MTKPKPSNKKSNAGRKWFDGKDIEKVRSKLEEAAEWDCTIPEMCLHADITTKSYYRFMKFNPEFKERIATLRQTPVFKARKTVVAKIEDSYGNAMDYLTRKRKSEFAPRSELTGADGEPLFKPIEIVKPKKPEPKQ